MGLDYSSDTQTNIGGVHLGTPSSDAFALKVKR